MVVLARFTPRADIGGAGFQPRTGRHERVRATVGGMREIGGLRHTMASMAGHVQRAQAEGLKYRHG